MVATSIFYTTYYYLYRFCPKEKDNLSSLYSWTNIVAHLILKILGLLTSQPPSCLASLLSLMSLGCLSRECLTPQTDTPSYWTSVMPNLLRLHACTRTAVAICSPTQWRWRQLRDKRFIEETASFQQYAVLIKCKHLFILLIVTLAFGVSIVAYSEIMSLCRPDAVSCFTAAALRKVTQIYMYTQTSKKKTTGTQKQIQTHKIFL